MKRIKKESKAIANQWEGQKVEDHGDYLILTQPYFKEGEQDLEYLKDPVNKVRKVTDKALKQGHAFILEEFEKWRASVNPEDEELKEGDKHHLKNIQDIVNELDRPFVVMYTPNKRSKERPMIFLPPRLSTLSGKALLNRLNL